METFDKFLRITAYSAIACLIPLFLFFGHTYRSLPVFDEEKVVDIPVTFSAPANIHEAPWSVVTSARPTPAPSTEDSISKRFRLAGTLSFESADIKRKIILDDLAKNTQYMLSEGDATEDGVIVTRIFHDRAILRDGSVEETLFLTFADKNVTADIDETVVSDPDQTAEEELSFGRRVGENRWELNRGKIMEYYNEIMDDPERLIKVFDSMKPLYNEGKNITGYILDIEGEEAMFNAFGLQEGDIVRTVNAMRMTSRNRAEYFIKEFAGDRVNAFVLDLERNGQSKRFTYLIH